jgi:hypothetical protein
MTIATGPFIYSVRLNHMSRHNTIAGVLSFKVEVEQLQKLTLSLSNMSCRFISADERALYSTFRIITYDDSINSEKSKSIVGDVETKDDYQVKYSWDTLTHEEVDLSLELITSIESLKSSSLQLCIWKDKTFNRYDDLIECRYKRFLSSDTEDFADLSVAHLSSRNIHNQKWKRSDATSKTARSFKMIKPKPGVPFKKSEQRSSTTVRNNENALIGTTLHRSLRKKISSSKRSNLENLEGECYISFQKLLSNELRSMDRKDSYLFDIAMRKSSNNIDPKMARTDQLPNKRTGYQSIEEDKEEDSSKIFSETLWLFGKKVGRTKGIFKVKLGRSIHQMGVGVMTENGIKFATSLILDNTLNFKGKEIAGLFLKGKEIGELPEKFKELTKLKNELFNLEASKPRRSLRMLQERERLLKKIIDNLTQNTGTKSSNVYEHEFSLLRTQDLFLVLLLH